MKAPKGTWVSNLKDLVDTIKSGFQPKPTIKPICFKTLAGIPIIFPVYLKKYSKRNESITYLKVVDRHNVQRVKVTAWGCSIKMHSDKSDSRFFDMLIEGEEKEQGYAKCSEIEYHLAFSDVEIQNNLLHALNLRNGEK